MKVFQAQTFRLIFRECQCDGEKNTFLLRWPQNATIKEAASETSEARKVEVKLKKEDLEKNGEKSEEVERVGTPEQVRPNFFLFFNEKMGPD